MPLNLQLGSVNVPNRTQRQVAPVGVGLEELGRTFTGISEDMRKLQNATKQEDPALAFQYTMGKVQELQQLEEELKSNASFASLTEKIGPAYKAFTEHAAKEMRDLNISKKASEKLFPRMLESFNSMSTYRSQVGSVEGQQKMDIVADGLAENYPRYGVGTSTLTKSVVNDDKTISKVQVPVFKFDNQHLVENDLLDFSVSIDEIAEYYGLDKKVATEFRKKKQEEFKTQILSQAMIQNPALFLNDAFAGGDMGYESIIFDPESQAYIRKIERVTPEEALTLVEQATKRVNAIRTAEKEEEAKVTASEIRTDKATHNTLLANVHLFSSASALKQAVLSGEPIQDINGNSHTFNFLREDEQQEALKSLQSMIGSGGIPVESKPDVLEEIQNAVWAGLDSFTTTPLKNADGTPGITYREAVSHLSDKDRREIVEKIERNQAKKETELNRRKREQIGFINVFWGKLTNFVSIFEGSSSALAQKSRTRLENAFSQLTPDQQRNISRQDLNQMTFDILTEEMENLADSQLAEMDTTQIEQFQALSSFETNQQLQDAKFENPEDRALAEFLFKIKQRKLAKSGENILTPKPPKKDKEPSTYEVIKQGIIKLKDALMDALPGD